MLLLFNVMLLLNDAQAAADTLADARIGPGIVRGGAASYTVGTERRGRAWQAGGVIFLL
jgi:hypothetical protein